MPPISTNLPGLPRLDRGSSKLPRLPGMAGPRLPSLQPRNTLGVPTLAQSDKSAPWLSPPAGWNGSPAEWAIYWAHERANPARGPEGEEWRFQSPLFGNFAIAGFVPDFSEYDVHVTIDVNEEDIDIGIQRYRAAILQSFNPPFAHIIIDEEDALNNPVYYLNEALAGRTHSRLGQLI